MQLPVRVYIEDTDAGGIVYYVNYLKFMERARAEFMRSLGFDKVALLAGEFMFVVHSLQLDYKQSARLDDELLVSAKVVKVGKATVVFEQSVRRDDQLLCSGEVKVACVRRADQRPTAMPASMLQQLQSAMAG